MHGCMVGVSWGDGAFEELSITWRTYESMVVSFLPQ